VAVSTPHAERNFRVDGLGIQSARRGDEQLIALEGDLEMANVAAVERELEFVESGDCRQIVLDLRGLTFLDSTGIQVLMSAHARSQASGRVIALMVDNGPVRRVLDVCGALSILPTRAVAA
jgi:stage II sporulation protein AA (anti-sigma F factor antagonist)